MVTEDLLVRILEVAIDFNFKDHRKIIERPIWAHHVEEADHLHHQKLFTSSRYIKKNVPWRDILILYTLNSLTTFRRLSAW